jgi:hypothetical protein
MTGFRGIDSDWTFFVAFLGIFLKLWEHPFEDFCSRKLESAAVCLKKGILSTSRKFSDCGLIFSVK